jgi:hypothetical protein
VTLYGPTNFASIINCAAQQQRQVRPPQQDYMVQLIITDGEITDLDETIDEARPLRAPAATPAVPQCAPGDACNGTR